MWRCLLILSVAVLLVGAAPARANPDSLLEQQRFDRIVNTVGYRLAASAGDLCSDKVALPGFLLHDLSQYSASDTADARIAFGFEDAPLILAVAPASRAFASGLREGDALLEIDGHALPPPNARQHNSYARIAAILELLDEEARDNRLALRVRRAGETLLIDIVLESGCASRFQTHASTSIDARADGQYVQVNTGLITFAGTEEMLAAVISHELAHNILHHRVRLDARGVRRGLLGQLGRSARLVRKSEEEADRLSVYLMDRAGYPPDAIIAFLTRYRSSHVLGFLRAPTHMGEGDRIALVTQEIARLNAMRAAGESPRPAFMMGPGLPELD